MLGNINVRRTIGEDITVYESTENILEHTQNLTNKYKALYKTLSTSEVYYKVNYYETTENFENEIKCLKKLQDSKFTPLYISSWLLTKLEYSKDNSFKNSVVQHNIMVIKTYNLPGKSLLKTYLPWVYHKYYTSGNVFVNENDFNIIKIREYFPEQYISNELFEQVIHILKILIGEYGIYHQNIHPGNFLEYNGKIIAVGFNQAIMTIPLNKNERSV
jgi:hypothetical protein